MKIVWKTNREKGLKSFGYGLITTMGIVFALSCFSTSLLIPAVAVILTGYIL